MDLLWRKESHWLPANTKTQNFVHHSDLLHQPYSHRRQQQWIFIY